MLDLWDVILGFTYVGLCICVGAVADALFISCRNRRRERAITEACGRLLGAVVARDKRYSGVGWLFMFITLPSGEHVYVGDRYRKYIGGLPLWRKHEIVDQLLVNIEKRRGSSDLATLCSDMTEIEAETMAQVVLEGGTYDSWTHVREELPNAIILFRLGRPESGFRPATPKSE